MFFESSLLWDGIDWGKNQYTVHTTKNRKIKKYHMSEPFKILLRDMEPKRNGSPFIFRQWKADSITHMVKRELKRIGRGDLHLHNLRHTFATMFIYKGGKLDVLQKILGHASITTTEMYAGFTEDYLNEEIKRINF